VHNLLPGPHHATSPLNCACAHKHRCKAWLRTLGARSNVKDLACAQQLADSPSAPVLCRNKLASLQRAARFFTNRALASSWNTWLAHVDEAREQRAGLSKSLQFWLNRAVGSWTLKDRREAAQKHARTTFAHTSTKTKWHLILNTINGRGGTGALGALAA